MAKATASKLASFYEEHASNMSVILNEVKDQPPQQSAWENDPSLRSEGV